jgi:Zn-finger nucleic acid-binding protein
MNDVVIGKTNLRECPRCEGIWADPASLQQICTDQERQSAVLGMANPLPATDPDALEKVRYGPCPVCGNLMNRVNFANCSHIVVDVCTQHGTWFDRDELRRIGEFIRAGGLEAARARQIAELEEQRRRLNAAKVADAFASPARSSETNYADWGVGIGAAAEVLNLLFRGKP